jgi:hypothetical protein
VTDPIADIIGDYHAFTAMQRSRPAARGIDIAPYELHHVDDWVPQRLVTATGPNPPAPVREGYPPKKPLGVRLCKRDRGFLPDRVAGDSKRCSSAVDQRGAAIVWAFTEPMQGSNQHQRKSADALGIKAFARAGLVRGGSAHQGREVSHIDRPAPRALRRRSRRAP